MREKSVGMLLVVISVLLIIIAFVADKILKITISDMFVMVYWIIVLVLIANGLYLWLLKKK